MRPQDLVKNGIYRYALPLSVNGESLGDRVVFKWITKDGKLAICHPEEWPDMQSMFSAGFDELEPID